MMVYRKDNFIIIKVSNEFIVYNVDKDWEGGHSHLKSFKAAKTAIDLALKRKIPRSTRPYFLITLQRISDDEDYIRKIEELRLVRRQKGAKQGYHNIPSH